MEPWVWVVLIAAVLVIVALLAWVFMRRRHSEELQQRFGPEYQRAVDQYQDRGQAEKVLDSRRQRVEQLHIQPLSQADQARFADAWRSVQAQFVDDPRGAIAETA
jgi:hypothetical protein